MSSASAAFRAHEGGCSFLLRAGGVAGATDPFASAFARWGRRGGRDGPSRGHRSADRGGRCPDVLEAAARAALIAEGVRIGLCEHEVRTTIESVQGWSGAASMCSKQAALRSERMALFERKFVD